MSWDWYNYAPRLSVAEQRRRAEKEAAKIAKKRGALEPVCIEGRKIANTFWGNAWCKNLESYSDYASRLPRGRSYVRNGCVIDLRISECAIHALVSGTDLYKVEIRIDPVDRPVWDNIKSECAGKIGSLIDLLQGKLSGPVMEIMTRRRSGLFPEPSEITFDCSCPDSAYMCKHVAATLYGVGARLDKQPELLFLLRNADQRELITEAAGSIAVKDQGAAEDVLSDGDLASVFGIDLDVTAEEGTSRVAEEEPKKKVRGTKLNSSAQEPKKTVAQKRSVKTAQARVGKVQSKPTTKPAGKRASRVKSKRAS